MPWYGYDRHKSRILIGSRSFCHGFYFGRDHWRWTDRAFGKTRKRLIWSDFLRVCRHVNRSSDALGVQNPDFHYHARSHGRTDLFRQFRSITVRTTDKNSHPVWFLVSADRRIRLHHRRFGTIIKRDGSISVSDRCRRIRDHDILHTLYDPASGTYLQMGGADHTGELETVLGAIFIRFQYDPSKKRME